MTMKATAEAVQPCTTSPSAVPAAGGCSVFVATMPKMPVPTESATITSRTIREPSAAVSPEWTIRTDEKNVPMITPTICPPTAFLGLTATQSGTTKTMNALEATRTTIATLRTTS